MTTTTAPPREARAIIHADLGEHWHLFRRRADGTLCGLPIPTGGYNTQHGGAANCPACVQALLDENLVQALPPLPGLADAEALTDLQEQWPESIWPPEPDPAAPQAPAQRYEDGTVGGGFTATLEAYQLSTTKDGLPYVVIKLSRVGHMAASIAANLANIRGGEIDVVISGKSRQLALWPVLELIRTSAGVIDGSVEVASLVGGG